VPVTSRRTPATIPSTRPAQAMSRQRDRRVATPDGEPHGSAGSDEDSPGETGEASERASPPMCRRRSRPPTTQDARLAPQSPRTPPICEAHNGPGGSPADLPARVLRTLSGARARCRPRSRLRRRRWQPRSSAEVGSRFGLVAAEFVSATTQAARHKFRIVAREHGDAATRTPATSPIASSISSGSVPTADDEVLGRPVRYSSPPAR